jgi:hypothetical protein
LKYKKESLKYGMKQGSIQLKIGPNTSAEGIEKEVT